MCTDLEHNARQLEMLAYIDEKLSALLGQKDEDISTAISSSQPYKLDYREHKYLYLLSPVVITITVEDIATLVIPANQWCNISFQAGMRLFAPLMTSGTTPVFIRATDYPLQFISPLAVAQTINSKPLSATNPEPNISNIQQMMLNGTAFSCATGNMASAASNAMEFFVTNAAKNVLIWSVRAMYDGASIDHKLQWITATDPNISGGTNVTTNALCNLNGNAAGANTPQSGFAMYFASAAAAATGTQIDFDASPVSQGIELMSPGDFRIISQGSTGGIAVYSGTAVGNKVGYTVKWVEY